MMEIKAFKFKMDTKAEEESDIVTFNGLASPFDGKQDLGGDIVHPGAFKRTLEQAGPSRILLWNHDISQPIGGLKMSERQEGLNIDSGEIEKGIQKGREMALLAKKGLLKGLSIGYHTMKSTRIKGGGRNLMELNLKEVSLTPFPMNEGAAGTNFKSEFSKDDIPKNFNDTLAMCLGYSKIIKKGGVVEDATVRYVEETIKSLNKLMIDIKGSSDSGKTDSVENLFDSLLLEKEVYHNEEEETLIKSMDTILKGLNNV